MSLFLQAQFVASGGVGGQVGDDLGVIEVPAHDVQAFQQAPVVQPVVHPQGMNQRTNVEARIVEGQLALVVAEEVPDQGTHRPVGFLVAVKSSLLHVVRVHEWPIVAEEAESFMLVPGEANRTQPSRAQGQAEAFDVTGQFRVLVQLGQSRSDLIQRFGILAVLDDAHPQGLVGALNRIGQGGQAHVQFAFLGRVVHQGLVVQPQHHFHVLVTLDCTGDHVAHMGLCLGLLGQGLEVVPVGTVDLFDSQTVQGRQQALQVLLDHLGRGLVVRGIGEVEGNDLIRCNALCLQRLQIIGLKGMLIERSPLDQQGHRVLIGSLEDDVAHAALLQQIEDQSLLHQLD